MALIHSFETNGQKLFRYRGQIPLLMFLIGIPYLYFSDYSWLTPCNEMILGAVGAVITILGILFRAYIVGTTPRGTSGRNREEQIAETLNTRGVYSIVRHPLYVGNYLMWAGILIYMGSISAFLIVSLIYWIYYERIMFREERFLEGKFGQQYIDWSMRVPAFIPNFAKFQKGDITFSLREVLKREYSGVFSAALCFAIVDVLRQFIMTQNWNFCRISVYVAAFFFVAMLILRTLKHHTKWLESR